MPSAPARTQRRRLAQAVVGGALVAHLRGDLLLAGDLAQLAGLVDAVRQRLLAEAVLAHLHRHAPRPARGGGRAC